MCSAGICVALACGAAIGAQNATSAQGDVQTPSARCRISGRLTSGTTPLPGASIIVSLDNTPRAITSSDVDGTYSRPALARRNLSSCGRPCWVLGNRENHRGNSAALRSDRRSSTRAPTTAPGGPDVILGPERRGDGATPTASTRTALPGIERSRRRGHVHCARDRGDGSVRGRRAAAAARLLRRGAQADAIAINGSGDATNLDRGLLNDRSAGDRSRPVRSGDRAVRAGFGPPVAVRVPVGNGGPGDGGFGGRGGGPAAAGRGRGGPGGGRGGFVLGGRGARAQSPYQGSATYTFGGSALDSPPYQLRPDVPVTQPQFAQNNFGAHLRRSAEDSRSLRGHESAHELSDELHRQPVEQSLRSVRDRADRRDARAAISRRARMQLIDPATGQPFPGNQIPAAGSIRRRPRCCGFIPRRICRARPRTIHVVDDGARPRRQRQSAAHAESLADASRTGGRGGGAGGGGFGGGGLGGRWRAVAGGGRGTNIMLNAQLQYRRNDHTRRSTCFRTSAARRRTRASARRSR